MPRLSRVRDGIGDSGACSQAIKWNDDGTLKKIVSNVPTVGCSMLVGSVTARMMTNQDYWLTTKVIEILEESPGMIRFMTENGSEYEFTYEGEIPPFEEK